MSSTNMNNYIKAIGVVVVIAAIAGAYLYPKAIVQVGSPAGSTFGTAKIAAINITPSSASATSTGIKNTDGSDRIITDSFVSCSVAGSVYAQTTAGVATWNWLMSTSTNAAPVLLTNTAYAANLTVGTSSTADSFTASSTTPLSASYRRWPAGTYLNIWENATSSTAACTAGVHYLAS